jgi:hypothetical protein
VSEDHITRVLRRLVDLSLVTESRLLAPPLVLSSQTIREAPPDLLRGEVRARCLGGPRAGRTCSGTSETCHSTSRCDVQPSATGGEGATEGTEIRIAAEGASGESCRSDCSVLLVERILLFHRCSSTPGGVDHPSVRRGQSQA